jgi:hypothetical protein
VKELYSATIEVLMQIRREGDDVNVIFWWEGFEVFRSGYKT